MTTFDTPILTVDVVLLCLADGALRFGTLRRAEDPFKDLPALPGGYVHVNEDADTTDTAHRVLRDKTGLSACMIEQLQTVSGPARDPRGWSATVVYFALFRGAPPTSDALDWLPAADPGPLAFDHKDLVQLTLARLRAKGSWSNLPAFFLPEAFTLSELRQTYELVLGTPLNDSAFRRKIDELDMITPIEGRKSKASARPAQLYRLKDGQLQAYDRRI